MRHWRCKLLEAIITEKMKESIVNATPKMQLGGMPKTAGVEHLVVLKTWMKEKEMKKEVGIFQTFDMSKFFDKESLTDCMYALNKKAKIDNKSYRIWFKINNKTRLSVKTSVGDSKFYSIRDSIGQGQNAAALVSSMNIGCAMEDTFKGEFSTKIGEVGINTVIFQDDIGKLNNTTNDAREGANKIEETLKRKLLSVNYDKSKYLLFGTEKKLKPMRNELKQQPISMGGTRIEESTSEKYLGDIISNKGCEDSITETIKERINKLRGKVNEIIQIAEHPLMNSVGNALPAFRLYEAMVIPALLHNCESWIGIKNKHYETLQNFQDNFVRTLLHLPKSTSKAIIQWDTGLMPMKWRIVKKKLLFTRKVMHEKPYSSLVLRVMLQEFQHHIKGLGYETRQACEELGIQNVAFFDIKPWQIKDKINKKVHEETKEDMEKSRKVADRVTENKEDNNYISKLTLPLCRIWFRFRARQIKGVKINFKSSHNNLNCRLCTANVHETQEHLQMCEGTVFERRGLERLEVGYWMDVLSFWRRMTVKLVKMKMDKVKKATVVQDRAHQDEALSDNNLLSMFHFDLVDE